jgi:hypothetical protein
MINTHPQSDVSYPREKMSDVCPGGLLTGGRNRQAAVVFDSPIAFAPV